MLAEYKDVFSNMPGRTRLVEHKIVLKEKNVIRLPPYQLAHAYRDLVQKELKSMLVAGIIKPSNSEWASPIVLVQKTDGRMRFCVNYHS